MLWVMHSLHVDGQVHAGVDGAEDVERSGGVEWADGDGRAGLLHIVDGWRAWLGSGLLVAVDPGTIQEIMKRCGRWGDRQFGAFRHIDTRFLK